MTLEEILRELESEDSSNLYEADETNIEEPEANEDNSEQDEGSTEEEQTPDDEFKMELVANLNRLLLLKDILQNITNYKQDSELMEILNNIRKYLELISEKIKNKDYKNIDIINNESNTIIKMVIVFIKQKIDPNFKGKEGDNND